MNNSNRILLADYISGISGTGKNYVKNASAFKNIANVTVSGSATVARNTTTPLTGISDFSITLPNNATDYVSWTLGTLDNSLKNQNCQFSFDYTASSIGSAVMAHVVQNSVVVAMSSVLGTASSSRSVVLNVPCGDLSTATTVRISNDTGNSGTSAMNVANVSYGKATNIGTIQQTQLIGSGYFATTASCQVSRTNTALGAFSSVGACPGPTVEFNPGPGTIQTTDVDLPTKITVNNLPAGFYKVTFTLPVATSVTGDYWAVAINDGTTTSGRAAGYTEAAKPNASTVVSGYFNYTTSGNRTFEVFGSSASGNVLVDITASNQEVYFDIVRYPSTSQQVFSPDTSPASWSGYSGGSAVWSYNSTTPGDPTLSSGTHTLTELQNRNFGTVSIAGSSLPGITFTPPRAGRYWVCAFTNVTPNSGNATISTFLTDGSNNILATATSNANNDRINSTCSVINLTLAPTTLKIRMADSATSLIQGQAYTNMQIQWSLVDIDSATAAPYLTGSVTSNTSGGERIERLLFAGNAGDTAACTSTPCTIVTQSGSWSSSVTRGSTGAYTIVIPAGIFSATPVCTCSVGAHGSDGYCEYVYVFSSPTAAVVNTRASGGALADTDVNIICMGPR